MNFEDKVKKMTDKDLSIAVLDLEVLHTTAVLPDGPAKDFIADIRKELGSGTWAMSFGERLLYEEAANRFVKRYIDSMNQSIIDLKKLKDNLNQPLGTMPAIELTKLKNLKNPQ
jgi:hypothetical protein